MITVRNKRKFGFELKMQVDIGPRDNKDCPALFTVDIEDLCDDMSDPDTKINNNGGDMEKISIKEVVALVRNLLDSYRVESMK